MNLTMMKVWLQAKLGRFFKEEKGEVNIVAMVVLIGIAVILALVFKDAIVNLINGMLDTIKGNTDEIMKPVE